MTQGVYIEGKRPKSKKAIKEAVADGKYVTLESTDVFGQGYSGAIENAPNGTHFFVGPDPYTNRKFYGQVVVKEGKITIK